MVDPVKVTPLPPVPSQQPLSSKKGGDAEEQKISKVIESTTLSVPWTQWFVQLREKINLINAILAAFSSITGSGLVVVDAILGTAFTRTIQGTTSNISVANGDGTGGDPTIDLIDTAVTPGSYGDSTHVGQFTVDQKGRLTSASNVAISSGTTYTADEITLHLSGSTFSIISTYVGQTSIVTLGTITTGAWNGTIIGKAYGGTGEDNSTGGTANTFWARPNGATGAAAYRAIVLADIALGVTAGSATTGTWVNYNGTTASTGLWDGGTTTPTGTTRINYGGYLYATRFYGDGSNLTNVTQGSINTSTLPFTIQTLLTFGSWGFQCAQWEATGVVNNSFVDTGSGQGTLAAVTSYPNTNTYTRQMRRKKTSGTPAGSSVSIFDTESIFFGDGGYFLSMRVGNNDAAAVAQARCFYGLRSATTTPGNVNPSTLTNIVGFGSDSGDTNLSLMYNDGSGSATVVGLGNSFPANSIATDWYEIQILCVVGGANIQVYIRNVTNGVTYSNTLSSDIPTSSTGLGRLQWRNNGTTALAVTYEFGNTMLAYNLQ